MTEVRVEEWVAPDGTPTGYYAWGHIDLAAFGAAVRTYCQSAGADTAPEENLVPARHGYVRPAGDDRDDHADDDLWEPCSADDAQARCVTFASFD